MPPEAFPFAGDEQVSAPASKISPENSRFLINSLDYIGFGKEFNDRLLKEMETGKNVIELSKKFTFSDTKETLEFTPRFERSQRPDQPANDLWYFFKGYTATLENDKDKSIFIPVFQATGPRTEQARDLLHGVEIGYIVKNNKGEESGRYVRVNFDGTRDESGRLPLEQVRADKIDYSIVRALNRIDFAKPLTSDDLKEMSGKLFKGIPLSRHIKTRNGTSEPMDLVNKPFDKGILVKNSKGQSYLYKDTLGISMSAVPEEKKEQLPAQTRKMLESQAEGSSQNNGRKVGR